jgi:YHS domain-containing protein
LPGELAPAVVKEASRQAAMGTEHVLPAKLPRHTFANTRLGLGGYCPVTLLGTPQQAGNWVIGDRRWGVVHRDRLYLFAAAAQCDQFLQDPDRYSPVISGYDPVQLAEHRQLVDGRREYGVTYRGRIYVFASEATLNRFYQSPGKYESTVDAAMQSTRQGHHRSAAAKPAGE